MRRVGMNQHQLNQDEPFANIGSDFRYDALRAAGKTLF
jgi:hypothetical protein